MEEVNGACASGIQRLNDDVNDCYEAASERTPRKSPPEEEERCMYNII